MEEQIIEHFSSNFPSESQVEAVELAGARRAVEEQTEVGSEVEELAEVGSAEPEEELVVDLKHFESSKKI